MKKPIENILANYFAGEASAEEIAIAEKFRKDNPEEFNAWQKAFRLSIFENRKFNPKEAKKTVLLAINNQNGKPKVKGLHWWFRVAAVFIGLLMVSGVFYLYIKSQPVKYQNATADLMNITLPDGTEVTLDKNATLSYNNNFWGEFTREVNMSGRLFFHVTKDAAHPFRVHGTKVSVIVLGTQFTVNELRNHTQVFLTEGKVCVEVTGSKQKLVITKPGEQVIVNKQGVLKQSRVNPALYASWVSNKVHFNNCTVKEVVQFLDDSYGVEVNISDKQMLNRKLFGSAPTDDEQLIISALSQILQTDIESK